MPVTNSYVRIQFRNVGRDKKTWTADVADVSDEVLIRQIRREGALMSRDIDVLWNDSHTGGAIYVGIWRKVGDFVVLP